MNTTLRATFVMEQHLGHRTFYQNLRRFTGCVPDIATKWVEITYVRSGSHVTHLPFLPGEIRGSLIGRSQVLQGLRQTDYDVAFFNTQVPAALVGSQIKKKPYVLCTDITPVQYDQMGTDYGHSPDRKGFLSIYKHRVNRNVFRRAAYIVPWSNWARASLLEHYGLDENRIMVIPPGVDTEVWKPGESKSHELCRILFVGGDFHRKGGDFLLEAFRKMPVGSCQLILVTKTMLDPEPGVVIHHNLAPNSKELISLYQSCDIFAIPSKAEAFGIAAVEASSVGLPVVATRIGGLEDIVVDGETGFFAQTMDAEALANRLLCLIENKDLRHKMGETGRIRVQTDFNARINAGRIINLLKSARGGL